MAGPRDRITDRRTYRGREQYRKGTLSRRRFLKLLGAGMVGAAGAAAGAGHLLGTGNRSPTGYGVSDIQFDSAMEFDTVLNAVDDLGMDPNGNEPIDGALESAYSSNTLIEFPPGDYAINDGLIGRDVSHFGIRGTGENPRDVTFTPQSVLYEQWINIRSGGPHLVENISVDQTSDNRRSVAFVIRTEGGSIFRDVEWLGRTPPDMEDAIGFLLTFDVTNTDGVGLVENITMGVDEEAAKPEYPNGRSGVRQGPSHQGEAIFHRMRLHDQGSAAFRSTNNDGVCTVSNSEFVDNANANLRFGAGRHPSKKSRAVCCYIHLTSEATEVGDAIRINADYRRPDQAGATVEDTTVVVEDGADVARAAIAIPNFRQNNADDGGHGDTTFRNCVVRNDNTGLRTFFAEPWDRGAGPITIENCDFTGQGGGFEAQNRGDSIIRDSCINLPNGTINGFSQENVSSTGCRTPSQGT